MSSDRALNNILNDLEDILCSYNGNGSCDCFDCCNCYCNNSSNDNTSNEDDSDTDSGTAGVSDVAALTACEFIQAFQFFFCQFQRIIFVIIFLYFWSNQCNTNYIANTNNQLCNTFCCALNNALDNCACNKD